MFVWSYFYLLGEAAGGYQAEAAEGQRWLVWLVRGQMSRCELAAG